MKTETWLFNLEIGTLLPFSPCGRGYFVFIRPPFFSHLGTQLDYISPSPLQLGASMEWVLSTEKVIRSDVQPPQPGS